MIPINPNDQMTLIDYYAAHAPSVPSWFKPSGLPAAPIKPLPRNHAMVTLPDSVQDAINRYYDSDNNEWNHKDAEDHKTFIPKEAIEFVETYRKSWNNWLIDYKKHEERERIDTLTQWPLFYAKQMLLAREPFLKELDAIDQERKADSNNRLADTLMIPPNNNITSDMYHAEAILYDNPFPMTIGSIKFGNKTSAFAPGIDCMNLQHLCSILNYNYGGYQEVPRFNSFKPDSILSTEDVPMSITIPFIKNGSEGGNLSLNFLNRTGDQPKQSESPQEHRTYTSVIPEAVFPLLIMEISFVDIIGNLAAQSIHLTKPLKIHDTEGLCALIESYPTGYHFWADGNQLYYEEAKPNKQPHIRVIINDENAIAFDKV